MLRCDASQEPSSPRAPCPPAQREDIDEYKCTVAPSGPSKRAPFSSRRRYRRCQQHRIFVSPGITKIKLFKPYLKIVFSSNE